MKFNVSIKVSLQYYILSKHKTCKICKWCISPLIWWKMIEPVQFRNQFLEQPGIVQHKNNKRL